MKVMNQKARFVLVVFMSTRVLFSGQMDDLSHICAYSNESVAKFRSTILTAQNLDELKHPGFSFDWPVDLCKFWISSLYGMRAHPSGVKKMHTGVDMAALKGTSVKSAANGVVSVVQTLPGYGNVIEIDHKNGLSSRYAHLHTMQVKVGAKVKLGDIIGTVGSTGNARGADPSHLHFEIIKDGKQVNPLLYLYWSERGYKKLKKDVY